MIPEHIKQFVDAFARLPSIGPRQAARLGYYLANQGTSAIQDVVDAVASLHHLTPCQRCFRVSHIADKKQNLCDICSHPGRNQKIVAIVEKETDLLSLEHTKKFNGRYLLLGEISRDGILTSAQKLRLNHLKSFVKNELGQAEEIILALAPTTYGDMDSSLIMDELKNSAIVITRLGRGLPTGGDIEFADDETLGSALEQRR
jgi:recombination protein RecR